MWNWSVKWNFAAWRPKVSLRRTLPGWETDKPSSRRKKVATWSSAVKDTCSSFRPDWPIWATILACRRTWPANESAIRPFSPFSVSASSVCFVLLVLCFVYSRQNNIRLISECPASRCLGLTGYIGYRPDLEIDYRCGNGMAWNWAQSRSITQPNSLHGTFLTLVLWNFFFPFSYILTVSCTRD